MNNKPVVSLVISTRNEENSIGQCLESINNQTYPHNYVEVIVVDNNSEDKTKEIAEASFHFSYYTNIKRHFRLDIFF